MEMTEEQLQEIKERVAKATPGPWKWENYGAEYDFETTMPSLNGVNNKEIMNFGDGEQYYPTEGTPPDEADAGFIAHAREDVPALIAEVERLRKENKDLLQMVLHDTHDEFVAVREIKKLREALNKIAYTNQFERLCDVEAFAVKVLEGEK